VAFLSGVSLQVETVETDQTEKTSAPIIEAPTADDEVTNAIANNPVPQNPSGNVAGIWNGVIVPVGSLKSRRKEMVLDDNIEDQCELDSVLSDDSL
jgi:hypothetical protein